MAGGGCHRWLGAALLLAALLPVSSLFEDQVGASDFVLKNIGTVTTATFHTDNQKRKVLVGTELGAVAALDVKTGELLWRQMLNEGESVDVLRLMGSQAATLSGGGRHLSLWDEKTGNLLWDRTMGEAPAEDAEAQPADLVFLPDQNGDSIDDMAVLYAGAVSLVSGDTGHVLWSVSPAKGDVILTSLVGNDGTEESTVTVVGASPSGAAAQITTLAGIDGAEVKSPGSVNKPSGAPKTFCAQHTVVSGGCFVCLTSSPTGAHMTLVDLKSGETTLINVADLAAAAGSVPADLVATRGGVSSVALTFRSRNLATVSEIKKEGRAWRAALRHSFKWSNESVVEPGQDKNGQELWFHARAEEIVDEERYGEPEGLLKVTMMSAGSSSVSEEKVINGYSRLHNGQTRKLFPNPYVRKDGTHGLRALLVTSVSVAAMVQQEFVIWEQHGALADTVAAAFVDIPVLPPLHDEMFSAQVKTNPVAALFRRFAADVTDLVQLPVMLSKRFQSTGNPKRRLRWDTEGVSLRHDMEGDRFGFKKVAVVLSAKGVAYGIHSETGAIIWRRTLSDSWTPSVTASKIFVTRGTSLPTQFGMLQVLVLGVNNDSGHAILWWINPLTGVLTGKQQMKHKVLHAAMAPAMMEDHTKIVILVQDNMEVRVIPDLIVAHQMIERRLKNIFFYLVASNGITGYSVWCKPPDPTVIFDEEGNLDYFVEEVGSNRYHNMQQGSGTREFHAKESWSIVFPEGETVATVAPHSNEESVKAAGRVLGNRGVLLKYINVNMVAIATQAAGGSGRKGASKDPLVRMYLIDTVVGGILHSVVHKDATGPVAVAQSEHVVLYSFWHQRKQHTELAVMELYENRQQELRGAAEMMVYNESRQSSLDMEKPQVLSQAYILPAGIKTMSVTNTMHGITTRNFILGLATDQVFSLDKRLVDPRRPTTKPTAADQEEGLVAYSPFIPLTPTSFLSYNQTIFNLRGISVEPARIESTCHILAFGSDIFYSKVTPSKAYDCLGDDFNYISLILSVAALGIGTQVASHFLQSRELSQAWK